MLQRDAEFEEWNICNCSNAPNLDCMLRLKHNQHRDSGLAACLTCTLSKKTERFNKASPLTKFSLRGITSLRAAFCDCTSSGRFIVLLKDRARDREREKSTRNKMFQGSWFILVYWSKCLEKKKFATESKWEKSQVWREKTWIYALNKQLKRSHGCIICYSLMEL